MLPKLAIACWILLSTCNATVPSLKIFRIGVDFEDTSHGEPDIHNRADQLGPAQ